MSGGAEPSGAEGERGRLSPGLDGSRRQQTPGQPHLPTPVGAGKAASPGKTGKPDKSTPVNSST